jgi:SNF2 family DNA or RNA helicase
MKLLFAPAGFNLIKARTVKGHYRQLSNGRIVYIDQHFDKRSQAKQKPKNFTHKVVHADEHSTTTVNAEGRQIVHKHNPSKQMSDEDIYNHLNSVLNVDHSLAFKVWMEKHHIDDYDEYLKYLLASEKRALNPRFETLKDAEKWLDKNQISKVHKELKSKHGDTTTYTEAFLHSKDDTLRNHLMGTDESSDYDQARSQMLQDHAEDARVFAGKFKKEVEKANKLKAEDCPVIQGLSPHIQFFGHQAEALAKLSVLSKAVVDVDMGGGKGLLLPADAMNLMAKGEVKRPLIIVPTNTLDQNAKLTVENYTEGRVNVFKMDNRTLKKEFGGDIEAMMEAVEQAPPNTIFMAGYDFVSANHGADKNDPSTHYPNAQALNGASFDYVACDESHRIKTTQTARFKAVQYLSKAKYKRVASGTFISNNPIDAIGQLKFLHPNIKWDDEKFKEEYGYEESDQGKSWSRDGTKKLREDLQNLGLISIRRSAWINKLPKRDEQLSIVKPDKLMEGVYETALDDVISQLLDDKRLDSGADLLGEGDDEEITPQFMAKFNALQAISDYPDKIAELIETALDVVGGERKAKKATQLTDEEKADLASEEVEAIEMLQKFSKATRAALRTLKKKVSPKALDVYKKMEEHFKDPKNGKFIIFCQRKLSAQHILDHMPEHLKQKALYYDANKKAELKEWATDPKGPQILVAVDASITEGVNLQIANGMYRYDHHYSPGTQEQSYARIWRPGQEKPVKIHLGIVDQTMDVTKVARMISKLHTNMMVTSDMDDDETFTAHKLNIDNIRNHRNAILLPQYMDMGKKILDFQKDEGKEYDKRYKGEKDGKYPRGNDAPLGGAQAKEMHGMPGYQEYAGGVVGSGFIDDDSKDQLLGHFRDYIRKNMKGKQHLVYDREIENSVFPHIVALAERHNASPSKKQEVQKQLLNAYANEYKKTTGEDLSENVKKAAHHAVSAWATGKKAPPHTSDADHEGAITAMDEHLSMDMSPKEKKVAGQTLKELLGALGSKKLKHVGQGMVENPEIAEAFWKKRAKAKGYDLPDDVKDTLMGAAALIHENQGGYKAVKHYVEDEE